MPQRKPVLLMSPAPPKTTALCLKNRILQQLGPSGLGANDRASCSPKRAEVYIRDVFPVSAARGQNCGSSNGMFPEVKAGGRIRHLAN